MEPYFNLNKRKWKYIEAVFQHPNWMSSSYLYQEITNLGSWFSAWSLQYYLNKIFMEEEKISWGCLPNSKWTFFFMAISRNDRGRKLIFAMEPAFKLDKGFMEEINENILRSSFSLSKLKVFFVAISRNNKGRKLIFGI